jgi:broad specificity phosphatase PhoE
MIVLVRHGQTDANRDGLLLGRADPALNERGRAQAAAVAATIAPTPVAVVTSSLRRTMETARTIAARWDLPVEVDDRLIELDYGEWDQRPLGEVSADAWTHWRTNPDFAPPGGESLTSVQERVASCASELLERAGVEGGPVVAVSHVSPIKAAVAWALGVGPEVSWRLRLDVAGVSTIARGPAGPTLLTWNATAQSSS